MFVKNPFTPHKIVLQKSAKNAVKKPRNVVVSRLSLSQGMRESNTNCTCPKRRIYAVLSDFGQNFGQGILSFVLF